MIDETQNRDSDPKAFSVFREKWVHEDNLINHRLNWLIMTQTILFAAYGLLLGTGAEQQIEQQISKYQNQIDRVIEALPIIGILVSFLILLGIVGAVGAMYELRKSRTAQVEKMDIDTALWTSILGQVTGVLMPVAFIGGWLYCIVA